MFKDPIVEEVRAARQKHAARFNYDLRKIAEDLKMKEQQGVWIGYVLQIISFWRPHKSLWKSNEDKDLLR